jgi:hypothetical protein
LNWIDKTLLPLAIAWIASIAVLFIWNFAGNPPVVVFYSSMVLLIVLLASRFTLNVYEGYWEAEASDRVRFYKCLKCGYRLKGNTSGVCPECGNEIKHEDYIQGE